MSRRVMAFWLLATFLASLVFRSTFVRMPGASQKTIPMPTSHTQQMNHSKVFHSKLRPDRSGAVIQDMLLAHAYAFHTNQAYGGACSIKLNTGDVQWLLKGLGLDTMLPLACPESPQVPILERTQYYRDTTLLHEWTSYSDAWLEYVRRHVQYSGSKRSAVIHMRRGDVTPCIAESFRYLPNEYYRRIMEEYIPKDMPITIYSESTSFEPLDEFVVMNRNVDLQLDTDLLQVWQHMMAADILVMSASSFSWVPALFNSRTVIYPHDFWYPPMQGWKAPRISFTEQAEQVRKRLQGVNCSTRP